MFPYWLLTRNRLSRRLYEGLVSAGVRIARLDRYQFRMPPGTAQDQGGADYDMRRLHSDRLPEVWYADPEEIHPGDLVIGAIRDGTVVGSVFVSADRPVEIPELKRRISLSGMYVWRLYVDPDHRGEGIATALVATAIADGREVFGTDLATAFVAPDNVPSRRVFERVGFEPIGTYTAVVLFGHRIT